MAAEVAEERLQEEGKEGRRLDSRLGHHQQVGNEECVYHWRQHERQGGYEGPN